MMQINRQRIFKGVMSIAAVSLLTACVDDKYDLTDIDTTSRFTVDNLTVPINLSEIKLDNIIQLDDNENITKIVIDGKESYAIVKKGDISTSSISINEIGRVQGPSFDPTVFPVQIPAGGNLSGNLTDLTPIDLPTMPLQEYKFELTNIDSSIMVVKSFKTKSPINIKVVLSIPNSNLGSDIHYTYQNVKVRLPWGLITEYPGYEEETGLLTIDELQVGSDGTAIIEIYADGMILNEENGKVESGSLNISGKVGVEEAQIKISVNDGVTIPSSFDVTADYSVSSFEVESFSGIIVYHMNDIEIDPISLNDLPDFLDSPDTELIIANPQILININNPVAKYGLSGSGVIKLISDFKGGFEKPSWSDQFVIEGSHSSLAFCTYKDGYEYVKFDGLRKILTSEKTNVGGLPESISVNFQNIVFAGEVKDFPLGNIGEADGTYEFTAPLGFGAGSKVIYETTEDGWGSDDLDDVNITKIHVKANCTTNLPVGVYLTLAPIDDNGNVIAVKEESSLSIDPKCDNTPIAISLEGVNGPIHGFDGIKFKAVISQDEANNTEALGPDLFIKLSDIRVTVDGYYETEF